MSEQVADYPPDERFLTLDDMTWGRLVAAGEGDPSNGVRQLLALVRDAATHASHLAPTPREQLALHIPDVMKLLYEPDAIDEVMAAPRKYRCACGRCVCPELVGSVNTLCVACAGCRGAVKIASYGVRH